MSIAISPKVKSWAIPQIDLKDSSLVLYVRFWFPPLGGTSIVSEDNNRLAATIEGTTWSRLGRYFDASVADYISFTSASYTARTWASWFNQNGVAVSGGSVAHVLISESSGGDQGLRITNHTPNRFQCGAGGVIASVNAPDYTSWNCLMATIETDEAVRLYLNGVLENTSGAGTGPTADTPVRVMSNAGAGGRDITGYCGEVLASTRAFTASEVAQYFQRTKWRYV